MSVTGRDICRECTTGPQKRLHQGDNSQVVPPFVEIAGVDLKLCPDCDGYVRPEWVTCANCGKPLAAGTTVDVAEPVSLVKQDLSSDKQASEFQSDTDQVLTPEPIVERPAAEPEPVPEPVPESVPEFTVAPPVPRPPAGASNPLTDVFDTLSEKINFRRRKGFPFKKIAVFVAGALALLATGAVVLGLALFSVIGRESAAAPAPQAKPEAAQWVSFQDPEQRFVMQMPSPPGPVQQSGTSRSISGQTAGGTTVRLDWHLADPSTGAEDALLQGVLANARASGLKVNSSHTSNQSARRQLSARLTDPANNRYADLQATRIGDRLYVLWVWSSTKSGDPDTFSRAIAGFKPVYR